MEKWRIRVKNIEGAWVSLGSLCDSEDEAMGEGDVLSLKARIVDGYQARRGGELTVNELVDCLKVIGGVVWSQKQARMLADVVGQSETSPPCRTWMDEVLTGGMVDPFAQLWPDAQGRFTCWNQYRNCRFKNEGYRIDYTLVDKKIFDLFTDRGAESLYGHHGEVAEQAEKKEIHEEIAGENTGHSMMRGDVGCAGARIEDGDSVPIQAKGCDELSALRACTAYGRWESAPYDGRGLFQTSTDSKTCCASCTLGSEDIVHCRATRWRCR